MYPRGLLYFFFFNLILIHTLSAQKYDKYYQRLDVDFATGDVNNAKYDMSVLKDKLEPKYTSGKDSALVIYYESKLYRLRGDFNYADELTGLYINKIKRHYGENSYEYLEALINKAAIAYDMDDYAAAKFQINTVLTKLNKVVLPDSELVVKTLMLQAKVLVNTGYYRQAEPIVKRVVIKGENRLTEKKEVAKKDGRKKFVSFTKEEMIERKRYLAEARLLNAMLLYKMGFYNKADEEFASAGKWIKKNLPTADFAYVDYLVTLSDYEMANGQYDKSIKLLTEAKKACNKKGSKYVYAKTHPKYLRICELLMQRYVNNNRKDKANEIAQEYRKIIIDNFPHFESYKIKLRIPFNEKWEKNENSFLLLMEKNVADIRSYRLPYHYGYQILNALYKTSIYNDSLQKAERLLNEYLDMIDQQCGSASVIYNIENLEKGYFLALYTDKLNEAEEIFKKSLHAVMRKELQPGHTDIIMGLDKEAAFFSVRDKFRKSLANLLEAQQMIIQRFGEKHLLNGVQMIHIAGVMIDLADYAGAEKNIQNGAEIIKKSKGKNSREYLDAMSLLTRLYIVTGRYREADRTIAEVQSVIKKGTRSTLVTFLGFDEEALLLISKGQYNKADEKLQQIIDYRKNKFGKIYHRTLIVPYRLASELYIQMGNYSKAEEMASKAVKSAEVSLGDSSLAYWRSQAQFCKIYSFLGDYDKAEEVGESTLASFKKIIGENHVDIGGPMTDLALVKYYKGASTEQVLNLLNKALEIHKLNLGINHPKYAESLQYKAAFLIAQHKTDTPKQLLQEANNIWVSKMGKRNAYSADIFILLGDLYKNAGDYNMSAGYYNKGSALYQSLFNKQHPKYINSLSKLSQLYYVQGNISKALSYNEKSTEANLQYVKDNFASMSEREKAMLWQMIRPDFEFFATLAISQKDAKPELLGKLLDISITTKAILLSSSIKVRERILGSNDPVLREKYANWLKKKEDLGAAIELTPEERRQLGVDLKRLASETESLERELSMASEFFKVEKNEKKIGWKNVKEALMPGEYLVDMVRYRYYDKNFTDSIIYAALIIHQKSKQPAAVLFNNGKRLETKYINYYKNNIKYLMDDDESFVQFFAPIDANIPSGAKIIFAPDGVFNQINLETLKRPGGKYLLEEREIVLVTNPKDLLRPKVKVTASLESRNSAILLGDPQFFKSGKISDSERKLVAQLPGTRKEIEEVNTILSNNRWDTETLIGKDAREEAVKILKNPRILHVATHGFFKEDVDYDALGQNSIIDRNKAMDNPLLKSGLLLYSAGEIIKTNPIDYNPNQGEGILTAYEAMNLSLDATDLVVLSACETGLGEVQVGEGVYGLQRAFQIAGAKSVIMSLFKVADDATQELMVNFYHNWLNKSMDKRKSFIEAKKAMLKKRPQPLYWGSFVMIGI
jgi:CHAT domain-containing protein/ATP/maltotriose-dependent transcriptional regulator MalT